LKKATEFTSTNPGLQLLKNSAKVSKSRSKRKGKKLYYSDISDQKCTELRNDLRVLDLQYRKAGTELKVLQDNPPPE